MTGRRGVELPEYLVGPVLYAVSNFIRQRPTVPAEVREAHRWLTLMSAAGHQSSGSETELEPDDLIGTAEAASLLGCSARHVRRLQADLDGAQPAGSTHLVFSRRSVIRYADSRREHRELVKRRDRDEH
ncbi:hypothetical protein AAHS21_25235 [Mycobacterium sp. 050272]|uniref:hypothetical protein n=1 Tax=Mycobacterium sp. 050272 TaxID=3142488 RepID=UPI003194CF92